MGPRRRKKTAGTTSVKKKAKTSSNKQDEAIATLYNQLCSNNEGDENSGVLQELVWPYLVSSSLSCPHRYWKEACFILASLLSSSSLYHGQGLEFVDKDTKQVFDRVVEELLTDTATIDYQRMAVLAHFVVVVNTNVPSSVQDHVSGIAIWNSMPERRRELELKTSGGGIRRAWAGLEDKDRKVWIVTLLEQVMLLLEGKSEYGDVIAQNKNKNENDAAMEEEDAMQDEDQVQDETEEDVSEDEKEDTSNATTATIPPHVYTFLHRSLELLIDLLSTLQTRKYLVPYMESIHFCIRCNISTASNETLIQQLLTRIQTLLDFNVSKSTKAAMVSHYYGRATTLQKLCHRHYPEKAPDVVYGSVGLLCSCQDDYLERALGGLSDEQVVDVLYRMRLVSSKEAVDRKFCLAVLKRHLMIPPLPLDQLKSFPLYPTEKLLWDFYMIPSAFAKQQDVLALPKLNTQFLSFQDYLLRNFELVRLSSSYDIRSDLVNVVTRVRPVLRRFQSEQQDDETFRTEFDGWARMALELNNVEVLKVSPPKLGQQHPAQVVAEIQLDLRHCGQAIRKEWDSLGEFDVLFLVAVDASRATGEPAPLMEGSTERRVSNEEDANFYNRFGVTAVRGCMVLQVRDEDGNILSDPAGQQQEARPTSNGTKRIIKVELDPAQYAIDAKTKNGLQVYDALNLVVRRHGRENNFKAVLETIRGLMEGSGSINRVLPPWLQQLLLGFGDPNVASYKSSTIKEYANKTAGVTKPDAALDYGDTFLDEEHLRASFAGSSKILVDGKEEQEEKTKQSSPSRCNYRVRVRDEGNEADGTSPSQIVDATSYPFPPGVSGNPVRFTPVQVEAVRSGLSPGLTVVVGPPGTGKTDVAVQIISNLYHSFPTQRTLLVTHSNAALNDLFEKVMARGDIDERYLIRLGSGESGLKTTSTHDFTKIGRVSQSLARRGVLLEQVQLLSESLGISGKAERGADGSPSYTCETAEYFDRHHVQKRVRIYQDSIKSLESSEGEPNVFSIFPFKKYFHLDDQTDGKLSFEDANKHFSTLKDIFAELAEYRPLELLRSMRQRTDYLLMKQAKVVAMTCTHAAIARSHLIELGFHYDNVIMEEAGQMLEVETFIPLLLQRGESDENASAPSRLKRVCLIGDHHQLPPVVKNMSFSKFSNLDQSLFSRLIRLGFPYIQLNKQGRARADIARLYSWRYEDLGNLEHVLESSSFQTANTGFAHTYQLVNVDKFQGRGETTPTPYFYQNMGEAEYVVALFQYMVLIGYPPERISILTTYNGQKELLLDILGQRCGVGTPFSGIRPAAVSTVDQYQGQQNDFVLLSLVRTEAVGHLRDVRRLVVAVSRARLGLYVFCRHELFATCHELKRTMDQFGDRPNKLQLVLGEHYPTDRKTEVTVTKKKLFEVDDVSHLGSIVHSMQEDWVSDQS